MQATLNLKSETNGSGHVSQAMTKAERYCWRPQSQRGRLEWIHKDILHVDTATYQRQKLSESRVRSIVNKFNWPALMPLGVFRRSDGTYWVYDGQHRLAAAKRRDDIGDLPCWVFDGEYIAEEANAFNDANCVRGPVRAFDRFRARLVAGDFDALAVNAALEQFGYRFTVGGTGQGCISCVEIVESLYRHGVEHMERVLGIVCTLHKGETFRGDIVKGLSYVDRHMMRKHKVGIERPDVAQKIMLVGPSAFDQNIRRHKAIYGHGGERILGVAIVELINKNKRCNKIASVSV
jgi:hypothetical protein